ncbi:MAG: hypothetical protein KAI50_11275 [Desulfobacterales bacterium]|nr:hypothetical protein [Desulfobacterales bacterium]
MFRLLIVAGIICLFYRLLKFWKLKNTQKKASFGKTGNVVDDVMIKDPFCEAYFPRKNGVHLLVDGKDLYFCSTECRDKFVSLHQKNN